jgi:hypothetical protein
MPGLEPGVPGKPAASYERQQDDFSEADLEQLLKYVRKGYTYEEAKSLTMEGKRKEMARALGNAGTPDKVPPGSPAGPPPEQRVQHHAREVFFYQRGGPDDAEVRDFCLRFGTGCVGWRDRPTYDGTGHTIREPIYGKV